MKRGDREEARGGECLREMATGEKYRRLLKLPTQRRGPTSGAKRPGRQKAITLSSWSEFKAVRQQVISQRGRARQAAGGGGGTGTRSGRKTWQAGNKRRGSDPSRGGDLAHSGAGGLLEIQGRFGAGRGQLRNVQENVQKTTAEAGRSGATEVGRRVVVEVPLSQTAEGIGSSL